jgi:hypothetical protein
MNHEVDLLMLKLLGLTSNDPKYLCTGSPLNQVEDDMGTV